MHSRRAYYVGDVEQRGSGMLRVRIRGANVAQRHRPSRNRALRASLCLITAYVFASTRNPEVCRLHAAPVTSSREHVFR